ncbi:MAG: HAMP domain-containing histidine kinase [Bacteroidaceae bacterium]|nr:HAMP domain-containing histidine kinase [Bacteroidaceae bacterium]
MKLTTHAIRSLILPLLLIFGAWSVAFYFILSDELIDEVDDQLEVYSERIMRQWLAGEVLPDSTDGTNNTYYIRQISSDELAIVKRVEYEFKNIYVAASLEEEPARVMHTVFERADGTCWRLTVMTPIYERNEVISTILVATLVLLVIMLLVVMGVFAWVFVRHTRPLYRVLNHLDSYAIGKRQALDNDTDVTEFQRLNESVTACLERIEEVYERERRFIGDASHELQTPLAICQNRVEMLMEEETLTESQMIELGKLQQTLSELIRLNKTLLFLSKIENNQYIERTEVNINTTLHLQLEVLSEVYTSKGIDVRLYEKGQYTLMANAELMTALVSNLLRNAYLHNKPQGTIDVYVTENALSIANTGDEPSLDTKRLFDRFYKATHGKKHSNGLGLSIAKAICEASHLAIHYSYEGDKHIFTVCTDKKD